MIKLQNETLFDFTLDDEKIDAIFPFVMIDSLDTLRFKSIVIERVFDFESFVLFVVGVEIIIAVGGGGGVVECCVRNFGAIRRRLTEPSNELSV
jgi:hypothetical protein